MAGKWNYLIIMCLLALTSGGAAVGQMFMPMDPFEGQIVHQGLTLRPMDDGDRDMLSQIFGPDTPFSEGPEGRTLIVSDRRFPASSSELADDGYGPYGASQAIDGERDTSWSEGVAGPGIGEWIAVQSPFPGTHLRVFAGWGGREATWSGNNRLQDGYIRIYGIRRSDRGDSIEYSVAPDVVAGTVTFDDAREWQNVININQFTSFEERYIAVLQIRSVYPGTRWDDTPIAEFKIDMTQ